MSLLPPNATPLTLALDSVLSLDDRLTGIETITGAKLDAIPAYLPWLIWEYGLGELMPYLPDARQAIRDGIAWQRVRGTPKALATALGWRGFAAATIEESGPGANFAAFQIDPGVVPNVDAIADMIALARLAAPARARLVRLYHDLDWRAARYDTPLDRRCLYDDWSGVDLDGVRQSFRTHHAYHGGTDAEPAGDAGTVTVWGAWHHSDPQRRWDVTLWDGATDTVAAIPALISVQSWHGPDQAAPAPAPAWWIMAKAMAADGAAYDSLAGVYDGYAVLVSDAPTPLYDAARYDAAATWRWLAAGDRRVDTTGAAFAQPEPEPSPEPALVAVIGIHFTAIRPQHYDVADPAPADGAMACDTGFGHGPGASAAPWGAGPWLRQPWGNTSGGMTMEVLS